MIDPTILDEMKTFVGEEACTAILEAFWECADELVGAMEAAHAAGDLAGLAKAAHSLKGSALNVGAVALADVAKRLETPGETAPALLATLRPLLAESRPMLERLIAA